MFIFNSLVYCYRFLVPIISKAIIISIKSSLFLIILCNFFYNHKLPSWNIFIFYTYFIIIQRAEPYSRIIFIIWYFCLMSNGISSQIEFTTGRHLYCRRGRNINWWQTIGTWNCCCKTIYKYCTLCILISPSVLQA